MLLELVYREATGTNIGPECQIEIWLANQQSISNYIEAGYIERIVEIANQQFYSIYGIADVVTVTLDSGSIKVNLSVKAKKLAEILIYIGALKEGCEFVYQVTRKAWENIAPQVIEVFEPDTVEDAQIEFRDGILLSIEKTISRYQEGELSESEFRSEIATITTTIINHKHGVLSIGALGVFLSRSNSSQVNDALQIMKSSVEFELPVSEIPPVHLPAKDFFRLLYTDSNRSRRKDEDDLRGEEKKAST